MRDSAGREELISYDALVVGTGAVSARLPIEGLRHDDPDLLGPDDGVHLLHSMGDTFAVMKSIDERQPCTAVVIGAGYIGLEMAEGLTTRGIQVTQIEALPEALPTVDADLGGLVHQELTDHGVEVHTGTSVTRLRQAKAAPAAGARASATPPGAASNPLRRPKLPVPQRSDTAVACSSRQTRCL